jgi:hypothetical protein
MEFWQATECGESKESGAGSRLVHNLVETDRGRRHVLVLEGEVEVGSPPRRLGYLEGVTVEAGEPVRLAALPPGARWFLIELVE